MKIKSYKKKSNNLYEITLDNNAKISLYADVILKYNLLQKKEIKKEDLEEIVKNNKYLESYYVAIKYLNNKLRVEKEIRKKLSNYDKEVIDYTIDRLQKEGYLNNSLYIRSYVNDEVNLKLTGPVKIKNDLLKLGFKEIEINNYLDTFSNEVWLEKIEKHIKKAIKNNRNYSSLFLKNKITNDLIKKGFLKSQINTIINEYEFSDNLDIYNKEYNKLKNKLSSKYQGRDLELQIKMRLKKKGF